MFPPDKTPVVKSLLVLTSASSLVCNIAALRNSSYAVSINTIYKYLRIHVTV